MREEPPYSIPEVLIIEPCDFTSYPMGGQLVFAKQLIQVFGKRIGLVGICTDDTPVGVWVEKEFNGVNLWFYGTNRCVATAGKPFIPARLTGYAALKRNKQGIMSLGARSVLIQAPEALMAVHDWQWKSICYLFPGVVNPLISPRYRWGYLFAGIYDRYLWHVLRQVDVILATADDRAIAALISDSHGRLSNRTVHKFPNRVDTALFNLRDKTEARVRLEIAQHIKVFVSIGRLNVVKGWDLILDAFEILLRNRPDALLVLVGDGEDRADVESQILNRNLNKSVRVTGFVTAATTARYLNASDAFVLGSKNEGWSIAMIEALACGLAIVSTDVSGARDMIIEGKNGFVVSHREPLLFAEAMSKAVTLQDAQSTSVAIAKSYSLDNMAKDLGSLWPALL